MSAINEMSAVLAALGNDCAIPALQYLVDQCAHRAWRNTDPLERVRRMCSEVAQCENQKRGREQGVERAVAGSTCVTIVRDYATRVQAGETHDEAWAAVYAQAEVPSVGAGGRPSGTRSDEADAFRAALREG